MAKIYYAREYSQHTDGISFIMVKLLRARSGLYLVAGTQNTHINTLRRSILWSKSIQISCLNEHENLTPPNSFRPVLLQLTFLHFNSTYEPANSHLWRTKSVSARTKRCGSFNLHVMFLFCCKQPTDYVGLVLLLLLLLFSNLQWVVIRLFDLVSFVHKQHTPR